jgi:hypothetical protein
MRRWMGGALAAFLLAGLGAGWGAASSQAASVPAAARTWTVTPGGATTAASGTLGKNATTVSDVSTGADFQCAAGKLSGTITPGSGRPGAGLWPLAKVAITGCSGPAGPSFTVTAGHLPWSLNAVSYSGATGVTKGTLTGIHLAVSGTSCSFTLDGTSATANNGSEQFSYTNSTGVLDLIKAGSGLRVYGVDGCFGLFKDGDTAALTGRYTVTPRQTITRSAAGPAAAVQFAGSGKMPITDTTDGTPLPCRARFSGDDNTASPPGIASITAISFSDCVGPVNIVFTVTPHGLPWQASPAGSGSGVQKGKFTGISLVLAGPGCAATVDGASATGDNGDVAFSYNPATSRLTLLKTGGNLHYYDVTGCFGLIHDGDTVTMTGSYLLATSK